MRTMRIVDLMVLSTRVWGFVCGERMRVKEGCEGLEKRDEEWKGWTEMRRR